MAVSVEKMVNSRKDDSTVPSLCFLLVAVFFQRLLNRTINPLRIPHPFPFSSQEKPQFFPSLNLKLNQPFQQSPLMSSMDYSVADMSCVLSASVQCEACKAKVQEILQNICGVYTITMDSEDGSVRICGRVNPRTFLKVIEMSGKHAEVKSIRFDGEAGDRRYYPYGDDPSNYLSYPNLYQSYPEQCHWFDRTYPNLPRPQPYPWQLMLPQPQPQPQPVPGPVIWPGWPHPDNQSLEANENNNQRCCTVM
ncbi:heavy metal-associated isoprenylated plant protein 42 isoform X2 [Benincasa hispida]|uniref:heavy metal-associated isoprenylated plant protein 42 isoform X2 n=1 Tax=Benincasa hispida TaxID=102211 RepID=UPI001900F531|nr:heavy metal-associated isoprenylated plant protein 42 isoform X2 [Benincasa hispida]